jgi:HD-like signal output (HDOD) protein
MSLVSIDGAGASASASASASDDLIVDDIDVDELIAARVTCGDAIALPPAVARVNDAVAAGVTIPEVTKLVALDDVLAANVARLARSAAYTGAVGERISLPYAVMRLGTEGVRAVCLTSSLSGVALAPGPLLALRRRVWRECLASALVCEAMGARHGASPNDAYLLGLLHDFGKVVAMGIVEKELFRFSARAEGSLTDAGRSAARGDDVFWADVAERHHCDVGWIVTDAWRLPAAIPKVTATHHFALARADLATRSWHELVATADRIVSEAARRGWQIAADDIATLEGVASRDEAMAVRIAIAKHPYYLTAVTHGA